MVTRAEVARVDCLAQHRAQTYDLRLHRNPSRQENERKTKQISASEA